ncbi:MAG: OmpH family outer membrane protein, partial [Acetobacteraceae bacterium]|nr:OmpH family outer membrane protein [Acetobacteraceae bacterium]
MPLTALAQGQDWFVPAQQKSGRPTAPARPPARPQAVQAPPALVPPLETQPPDEQPAPPIQVELPPAPDVPAQPKGNPPPTAVIGVLGLGEISRASVAAQAVDKTLNERMTKLQDDARKEQAAWRELQQQLASAKGLSADQLRAKERELQERVTNAQRQFRDRNRIIQEAAQYARAQIERTLRQIVIRVSEAHGINVVLHQEQVVLNYPAFDITQEVVEVLNKVLPSVVVPPDGVSVSQMPGATVPTAQAQPGGATPAA